ncbi:hypothetical protein HPB47_017949 [Ixodes persulcatus]|uniref:Uncharacterized protein n=1 Tax=Ixodes persulcatus TaxID=34615 RepID=A0AC60QLZ6_IXOPE|nr:hypothetical protein HPB47_017949 [Ixodes persulcatus]
MVVEDEYGNAVGQGDSIDMRLDNDSHASDSVSDEPVYDEARCLADSFAEYGKSTFPHSSTTKAEAVALIMEFLTSENMPWTALDKLLHLVNRLFGAGTGYRHLQQSGLHEWTGLTITFNTDGSPLYKSSRASVWPVQFIINELPPSERFNHCVLGGLWFGASHPDMILFMTKFVEEVTSLGSLTWEHDSTVLSSKVHALCCCFDAPARAEVRDHVQYNGYFGCSWCLASGEHLEGSLHYRGTTSDEERTPEGVRRDMQLTLLSGASLNGVKGPSPLTDLPHFNLVWGFSVDYMHCVLLGVIRQFTEYLSSSINCRENNYIVSPSVVPAVNKRLLSIRPPHCVTRLPRPVGDRSFWNASEWRQWLLFYCLSCTLGILDQHYWKHLRCLVEAVYILLLQEFTRGQLDHAGKTPGPACRNQCLS